MLEQDLLPFFSPKGQDKHGFWTSASAEKTDAFGYTYLDVKGDPQATKSDFRDLYSWSVRPQPEPENWQPSPPKTMEPLDLSNSQVYKGHSEYIAPTPPVHVHKQAVTDMVRDLEVAPQAQQVVRLREELPPAKTYREWFVDDTVER